MQLGARHPSTCLVIYSYRITIVTIFQSTKYIRISHRLQTNIINLISYGSPSAPAAIKRLGLSFCMTHQECHVPPALLPAVFAALPTGPGAALALVTAAVAYVLTQRDIDASIRIH